MVSMPQLPAQFSQPGVPWLACQACALCWQPRGWPGWRGGALAAKGAVAGWLATAGADPDALAGKMAGLAGLAKAGVAWLCLAGLAGKASRLASAGWLAGWLASPGDAGPWLAGKAGTWLERKPGWQPWLAGLVFVPGWWCLAKWALAWQAWLASLAGWHGW